MFVGRAGFVPQTPVFTPSAHSPAYAAAASTSSNQNAFSATFAAEMSSANTDLASGWTGFGADVLPHFGTRF